MPVLGTFDDLEAVFPTRLPVLATEIHAHPQNCDNDPDQGERERVPVVAVAREKANGDGGVEDEEVVRSLPEEPDLEVPRVEGGPVLELETLADIGFHLASIRSLPREKRRAQHTPRRGARRTHPPPDVVPLVQIVEASDRTCDPIERLWSRAGETGGNRLQMDPLP